MLRNQAAQPPAPSASDGGGGDGDRGVAAVAAETDTPPGGGSSPLALKEPRSFPAAVHAPGRRGHRDAAPAPPILQEPEVREFQARPGLYVNKPWLGLCLCLAHPPRSPGIGGGRAAQGPRCSVRQ